MENKKAIVIDGNSLVYRAYYATWKTIDSYKQKNIQPLNAVKLTSFLLLKLLDSKKYDYAFVAFDHHKKTFRNELDENYKMNRSKTPDDLISQIPLIQNIIEVLGMVWSSKQDYEADDLVGSFAEICSFHQIECDVYTSDKDMLQLVNEYTNVFLLKTGISEMIKYDKNNFSKLTNGLNPSQFVDYKAIVGDNSDNFKGIPGIGPKTAINLIKQYGSLLEIFNNVEKLSKNQKQKFLLNKENGFKCYKLAQLKKNLFNNIDLLFFSKKDNDVEKLNQIIKKYNFSGFDKWIK